jgi:Type IV secretion system pilin
VAAVIAIIISGLRYVTSAGDSNSINGAKNTILYAVIGLVIVAMAQIIVKFVLGKAT